MTAQVLIISDSLTVRMDLKEAFESSGYATMLAPTAAEARQHLAATTHVGLIVLDLVLPDADGIGLLDQLKGNSRTASIPVMLLCTEAEVRARAGGLSRRADECVGKPYDRAYVLARAKQLVASGEPSTAPEPAAKLLAVDDSPTYLHALAEQLRQDGHQVTLTASGAEALQLLAVEPVDCILLDLIMPGLSGEETCRQIKESPQWRSIPVIMLTAREDREAMIASFNAGADDFISKSADPAVLRSRLRAQLRRRELEAEHHRILDQLHQREVEAAEARANRELTELQAAHMADLERKNVELTEAREVAERASLAKDRFLAVLSHELRTPLAPVLAAISMLQRQQPSNQSVRSMLEMIRRNVELEARLIDDLLDLTRIAKGKVELNRQQVELCTIIERAVEVCRPDLEARRLEFGVDIGPAAPYLIEADAARLQQVFWNLLKNAVKFTPRGGCVGIRCRLNGQGGVVVEVSDSGAGIPAEALPHIFDAFAQADRTITRQFGGLGLGLAISKSLVEMHGGVISAHSEGKDKGATFTVQLPLAVPILAGGAVPASTKSAQPGAYERGSLRVLLVEDHGDTAEMMRLTLESEGHHVETAGAVATALETAGRDTFDLLISDLGLPDGSGIDLIRALRANGSTFPSIALSGYGQESDIEQSLAAGFAAHMTKPVDPDRLIAAISKIISSATEPA